ncbi:MAG: biopolymer transporter ExbD [Sphingobacteriales bacterium]|nr:MAG: biopolymer transporter ExbD [Sphingobacteriales bacterium]
MAEINDQPTQKKRKGSAIFSKKSLKVDLTPMVDLGFILITFFVFTSTIAEKKTMDIVNPVDTATTNDPLCESCVLTVLPDKDNKIWYYEGMEQNADYKETNYSTEGLRKLITEKKGAVKKLFGKDRFILIIKPLEKSAFKNLVDIIDESHINVVMRYYITEPSLAEKERFK